MYDVNPLGPMMHLKELERQAVAQLKRGEGRSNITALGEWLAIAVWRMFGNRGDARPSKPFLR